MTDNLEPQPLMARLKKAAMTAEEEGLVWVADQMTEAVATLERVERERQDAERRAGKYLGSAFAADARVEALRAEIQRVAELSGDRASPGYNEAGRLSRINEIALAAISVPAEESAAATKLRKSPLGAYLLAEAEAEESSAKGGWQKPEAEHDDGEISVSAFNANNSQSITFTLKVDHVVVTECAIGQPTKSRKLYVTPPAEARSEQPEPIDRRALIVALASLHAPHPSSPYIIPSALLETVADFVIEHFQPLPTPPKAEAE